MLQIAILLASLTVICGHVGAIPACALSAAPTVRLDSATVTGIASESGSVNQFLGIPYAHPPTDQLRFRLPQALPPYDSDFSAMHHGHACPQMPEGPVQQGPLRIELIDHFTNTDDVTYSEDCLTLNVVTPANATPTSKLPVAVWIHGGGFENGHHSKHDGSVIVERSVALGVPAVHVSINYRLNLFGFLASKEIKDAGVGNLGLWDQRLALKWVQKYISAFGGDPTKVTIWGESAGAMSVAFHMLANGGNPDGLFRAAFMQSGSPIHAGDMSHGQKYYDILVEHTECSGDKDTLECLRNVPYEKLMDAIPDLSSNGTMKNPWCPRVDGVFLTENPYNLVRRGAVARVPFVNGVCDDEGTVFSIMTGLGMFTDIQFEQYLRTQWMANSSPDMVRQVMAMYPQNPFLGSPFNTGGLNAITPQYKRLAAFQGDLMFQAPRRFFLQNLSSRQNTWTYVSKRNKWTPIVGAHHASDLANVYGGGDMASYLVRFVTNLDPNVGQSTDIHWPQYNSITHPMLEFSAGSAFGVTSDTPATTEWGSTPPQIPVQIPGTLMADQALTTDTYRFVEIKNLFDVAEENPF